MSLGSFSARIRTAHGLSWISDAAARDLDTIRSIPNEFAHSFDHALATFQHHGLTVVSRDTAEYVKARVPVFNPWVEKLPDSAGSARNE